jgi:hypothetical protein
MGMGFTHYKGFRAAQHENFPNIFGPFLEEQQFDIIIEIGTLNGGLTRYLRDASPKSRIVSYDIATHEGHDELRNSGVEVKIVNIFDGTHVVDNEAIEILKGSGKKLIICDGGNKAFEFNCLAPFLKSGDFIMAHDYSKTRELFDAKIRGNVWDWCELVESDISSAISEYGLQDYQGDLFQTIVWACKKKP